MINPLFIAFHFSGVHFERERERERERDRFELFHIPI